MDLGHAHLLDAKVQSNEALRFASGTSFAYRWLVGGVERLRLMDTGALGIVDGITNPAAVAGLAFLYVDTADGDLKVKFGDGTVKTIVVDT